MEKKKCFIITPIGNDSDPIRRHIEGIIDAAIEPCLGDDYEIRVSHRLYQSGTITKQIVSEIYNADLVIANLTEKNPNVMYELAFRHCLGTPVITIAENETQLPADIIGERTIFYENDAQGVLELRVKLTKFIADIDSTQKISPILDALKDILDTKQIIDTAEFKPQDKDALNFIFQKLNEIETKIELSNQKSEPKLERNSDPILKKYRLEFPFVGISDVDNIGYLEAEILQYLLTFPTIKNLAVKHDLHNNKIVAVFKIHILYNISKLYKDTILFLKNLGYTIDNNVSITENITSL